MVGELGVEACVVTAVGNGAEGAANAFVGVGEGAEGIGDGGEASIGIGGDGLAIATGRCAGDLAGGVLIGPCDGVFRPWAIDGGNAS